MIRSRHGRPPFATEGDSGALVVDRLGRAVGHPLGRRPDRPRHRVRLPPAAGTGPAGTGAVPAQPASRTPGGTVNERRAGTRRDPGAARARPDRLLTIPGVLGVGFGLKEVGDELTERRALRVYVDEKKPLSELAPDEVIPDEIEGVPTDVVRIPRVVDHGTEDKARHSPLLGGITITNNKTDSAGQISLGTLGCFATIDGAAARTTWCCSPTTTSSPRTRGPLGARSTNPRSAGPRPARHPSRSRPPQPRGRRPTQLHVPHREPAGLLHRLRHREARHRHLQLVRLQLRGVVQERAARDQHGR